MKSAAELVDFRGFTVFFSRIVLLSIFFEAMFAGVRLAVHVDVAGASVGVARVALGLVALKRLAEGAARLVALLAFGAWLCTLLVAVVILHLCISRMKHCRAEPSCAAADTSVAQGRGHAARLTSFPPLPLPVKSFSCVVLVCALSASRVPAQHDMSHMGASGPSLPLGIPWSRLGSGTSWIPDSTPMRAAHADAAAWRLMLMGSAFGQLDRQNTLRGDTQLGLVDWEMLMAMRAAGGGALRLTAMTSFEALVLGKTGYPELVQTGGVDRGARLVNRQHPHDLIGELSVAYDRFLTGAVGASVYAAAVGEPAIGPVSYRHRESSALDPMAPLGHHLEDATHVSNGVLTAGVYSKTLKLEGSAFNARESDNYRYNIDYAGARVDSYSGRVTLARPNIAIAAWAGYVYAHDRLEDPIGMQRYGVSVVTSFDSKAGGRQSSTLVYGYDVHHHGSRHHNHGDSTAKTYNVATALLWESSVPLSRAWTAHLRFEQVDKNGDELGYSGGDLTQIYEIRPISFGLSYALRPLGDAAISIGGQATLTMLPLDLESTFRTRYPMGFVAFVNVRPRAR
jgi:hypothetical protein